jgi:hypothetical protein
LFYAKGYLGHVLNTVFGLKVIGLESKQSHTSGADRRTVSGMYRKCTHNLFCNLNTTDTFLYPPHADFRFLPFGHGGRDLMHCFTFEV